MFFFSQFAITFIYFPLPCSSISASPSLAHASLATPLSLRTPIYNSSQISKYSPFLQSSHVLFTSFLSLPCPKLTYSAPRAFARISKVYLLRCSWVCARARSRLPHSSLFLHPFPLSVAFKQDSKFYRFLFPFLIRHSVLSLEFVAVFLSQIRVLSFISFEFAIINIMCIPPSFAIVPELAFHSLHLFTHVQISKFTEGVFWVRCCPSHLRPYTLSCHHHY